MAQNMPLSLKGLDPELREAARDAARRAGLSVNEWLETAIRGHAGYGEDDEDGEESGARDLDARLARLSRAPAAPRRERGREAVARHERLSAPELEALVTHAARLDARTRETETKTTTALESILHWIERTEGRMAANEREAHARQERATSVIADAIKTVSSRVAEVERRASAQPAARAPAPDIRAAAPQRPLFSRDNLAAAVSDIRARQHALANGSAGPGHAPQVERRAGERRADVTPAMNDIRSDIARLRDEIGRITQRPVATGLEDSIRDLARKLEARETASLPDDLARPLARIEAEMARLGGGAGDERFTRVEREIARLGERIEALANKAGEPRLLAAAVNEIATLKKQVTNAGPARIDELSSQIAALSRDMGTVREEIARSSARAPFEAALQDMREALSRDSRELSGIGHGLMQRIAHQLEVVGSAVSSMPTGSMSEADRAEIAALSRKLDQLAQRTEPESGEMARRIESLAIKLEDLSRIGSEELLGRVDRLSEQLEILTARGPAAIEKQIDTLAARIETLAKSNRLEAVTQGATVVDLAPLEGMIGDLARRMDEAVRPDAGSETLKALEAQIATLTARLDRAPQPATSDGLEATLQDLMRSLGGLREETASAVDRAARAAVAEAIGHGPAAAAPGEDIHLLRQDLAGLRDIHASIDTRTHSAIGAVNDTLEKIVSRLAQLEDDIQRDRAPSHSPAFDMAPAFAETAFQPAPQPAPLAPRAARPLAQPAHAIHAAAEAATPPDEPRRAPAPAILDASAPSAADMPLEPGSGRPRAKAETPAAAAPLNPNLIAAARRAAQAAGIEAGALKADPKAAPDAKAAAKAKGGKGSFPLSLRETLEKRRKPILLGLAAIVLAIGAGQVATTMLAEPEPVVSQAASPRTDAGGRATEQPAPAASPAPPAGSAQPLPAKDQQSLAQPDAARGGERLVETTSSIRPGPAPAAGAPAAAPQPAPEAAPAQAPAHPLVPQKVTNLGDLPANLGTAGMRRAALEGDANAVHELAARAADGAGSPRDPRLALRLFERAAAAGHAPSQFRLGNIHEKGIGAPRDAKLAATWYKRAAERGNAKAMHNLAVLIAEGVEGRPDYAAAAELFRKAAEFGVRDSQYNLAILLGRGLGLEQDLVQSYAWFAIAARGGDADAAKKRDEVGGKLAGADAAAANSLALSWKPKTPDPVSNEVTAPAEGWDPQPRQNPPRAQQPRPRST